MIVICMSAGNANAQIKIDGATCVLAGLQYQYLISGINTDSVAVRICVTGGTITGSDSTCTEGTLPYVQITWNDSSAGSISVSSVQGNGSFDVNVTNPLLPGSIDSSDLLQVVDTAMVPGIIHCAIALNGVCNPNYQYQWQQFVAGEGWTDVAGGNAADLAFTSPIRQTTYYRRKVTDRGNSQAFSNEATVIVNQ